MKIAFIGAGWVAGRHLGSLAGQKDFELVGVVSPVAQELETATRRWGGRGYASVPELLKHEQVEAAWITVPPGEHGAIEETFIERGIPMFIEKPLSADRATGERIAEKIRQKGVITAVGYHWRAMDTLVEVKKRLAENPARMVLGAWHDSTPPPLWWRHQHTSGGQIVEQATHLFDLGRYLVGEARLLDASAAMPPRPAYPDADVHGVSAALVSFENNIPGLFSATCLLSRSNDIYVKIVCEGLLITITQTGVSYESGAETRQTHLGNDPFLSEDLAFVQAIRRSDPGLLYSSYADALKTHALCHSALERYRSAH